MNTKSHTLVTVFVSSISFSVGSPLIGHVWGGEHVNEMVQISVENICMLVGERLEKGIRIDNFCFSSSPAGRQCTHARALLTTK